MPEAVIVSAVRTPVGRAYKGSLRATRPDDLAALAIKEALARVPGLDAKDIDDVILGCAMPEGEQGMNVARIASLRAGLPVETSAMTINRFCSSGLQAIALAADRIRAGSADVIIAGGSESMSMIPAGGRKPAPNPWFVDHWPEVYMNIGLTAQRLQRKYGVSRHDSDASALRSHRNALRAQSEGRFADEIVPVEVENVTPQKTEHPVFSRDEGPRADTSLEVRAKLKPVFHVQGTVTAGNSSQTSDGAAAALVMSDRKARGLGLRPMARFVSFAAGGGAAEIMGIGPRVASPQALEPAGRTL